MAGKQADLPAADLRGQASVDDAGADAVSLQPARDIQNGPFGEHDQGVPFLHILRETDGNRLAHQRGFSLVAVNLPGILTQGDQMGDYLLGGGAHAYVDFLRLYAQNGPGPGMAPVGIGDHLRLIDDSHFIFLVDVQHFHGGGYDPAVVLIDALLPGEHGTGDARILDLLINLQGQQTQRPQINPGLRPAQAFQRLIGLAAVGGTDMEDEMTVHLAGLLKFRFRPGRNHVDDLAADACARIACRQPADGALADLIGLFFPQIVQKTGREQLLILRAHAVQIQADQLLQKKVADLHDGKLVSFPEGKIGHVPQLPVEFLQMSLRNAVPGGLHVLQKPVNPLLIGFSSVVVLLFKCFCPVPVLVKIELYQLFLLYHKYSCTGRKRPLSCLFF